MRVSISGSMNSTYYPLHSTFSPVENLNFTAYCMRRSALLVSFSRRKRMSKPTKERTKRLWMVKRKLEMKNLKLYTENKSIIEANEKLRKRAALLHLENLALHSQLQIKFPTQLSLLPN